MTLSFRKALTLLMVVVLALTIAVSGVTLFIQNTQSAEGLMTRAIRNSSTLIEARVEDLVTRAEGQSRLVAALYREKLLEDSLRSSPTSQSDLLLIGEGLISFLRENPEFGSLSVKARTGGVRVDQLVSGELIVFIWGEGVESGLYRPFGNRLVERERISALPEAPSFSDEGLSSSTPAWSSALVFRNLQGVESPAVTLTTPVLTDAGQEIGSIQVVYTLTDLSRYLSTVAVSRNGYAALLELNENGEAQVIGYPNVSRLLTFQEGRQKMLSLGELNDPVLASAIAAGDFGRSSVSRAAEVQLSEAGQSYFVGFKSTAFQNGPKWVTVVVVPTEDFLGPARTQVISLVSLGFLALGIGVVTAFVLAKRLANPLQALAREANRVQSLDFSGGTVPRSEIREINELSQAMERMKIGLRSMEKLVPQEYARYLVSSGQEARLGGERRHLTTSFADIVGFTRLSSQVPPEELMEVLTDYLDVLSGAVLATGGTIDKFNGDDVMAFWGAPTLRSDHAIQACRTALESQEALGKLHSEWRESGRPLLTASFGIATGDVVVGNVGSRQRMNYTVLGDTVNLANRLQGFNRFYGTSIQVAASTVEEAGDSFLFRLIDVVTLLGRDEPVELWELVCFRSKVTDKQLNLVQCYGKAFRAYQSRDWGEAEIQLASALELCPEDGPSLLLLKRIADFRQNPPEVEWTGSVPLTLK
ncbi:MAG: hypothetical protein MUC92_11285 [Fimbriimonadaceae bacterium]|jgi:adenylate cyclase|nr:hypothetical protein [Fimbriimonadaceae bacterium]